MYSREDVVKLLLTKRGVDPFSTGGVSIHNLYVYYQNNSITYKYTGCN